MIKEWVPPFDCVSAGYARVRPQMRILFRPFLLGLSEDTDPSGGARVEGGGYDRYFPAIDEGAYVPEICRAVGAKRAA